jgi:hypothetical protein
VPIGDVTRLWLNPRTRRVRAAQLAYSAAQVTRSVREGAHQVLMSGNGMLYLNGRISVSSRWIVPKALFALLKGQPVILFRSTRGEGLRTLCSALRIDDEDTIHAIVSMNPVTVMCARRSGLDVIIHAAPHETGPGVDPHISGLNRARDSISSAQFLALLPIIVDSLNTNGIDVVFETRMQGKTLPPARSQVQLEADILAALGPLRNLDEVSRNAHVRPDANHIETRLPGLLSRFPSHRSLIREALTALRQWRSDAIAPVFVHGDYWLGNILFDGNPPKVSGILDWDRSRVDGCSGYDALHLLCTSVAMHGEYSISRCFQQIWSADTTDSIMSRILGEIRRAFGVTERDLGYLTAILWLTVVSQKPHTADGKWQDDMIRSPAECFRRWRETSRTIPNR